jgi:light-regulated signal transduction histidine kinase (bacteriophytochrome)
MAVARSSLPAFGQADLSNCEREQIQLAGSIQPHGALLVVREPDQIVVQESANAAAFLGLKESLVGQPLTAAKGDLAARIRPHLGAALHVLPIAVRCQAGDPPAAFDVLLHRPPAEGLVVELERAGPPVDVAQPVMAALQTILAAPSLRVLCDETARIFKDLTGYDRVMVYRFDDQGHGEVLSEQRETHLEPYLGNWYPASDIPRIARLLYERNRVRVLVDVAYAPVPLVPRLSPITGRDLDMSLCFLRSMSPIHIQYLKNMGVAATLVVSLVVGGRLWGLVACHHYAPRLVHCETRAICELLAESVATRIAALESFLQAQAELSVRRLEQRMIEAISREGDWRTALFDNSQSLLHPVGATGAALLFEDQVLTAGDVPGTTELRAIGRWLDAQPPAGVFATASLGLDAPAFANLKPTASGLLATPVSSAPGEYLLWFRPERIRTVTWGGNPFKAVVIGDDPSDLSPRRSFAQWHQLVEGTSGSWSPADLAAARLIGGTLTDVVLQFRAVRMLIAQDQLRQVRLQVLRSGQPIIIADADGTILLTNEAFDRLLPATSPPPAGIADLPALFTEPAEVGRRVRQLLERQHTWRGEVGLRHLAGDTTPMLVRADPVFSAPQRVLGYVLLFTDLTERKALAAARQRFQEGILEGRRTMMPGLRDAQNNLRYRSLLSAIIENAQLAAMEITDGVDVTGMPEMLESLRSSVSRSRDVLEHLIRHASRAARSDD